MIDKLIEKIKDKYPYELIDSQLLICGDCLKVMKDMGDNSVDSIVCDPPYGLSFMGKKWDYDVPKVEIWKECLRVLKHGGHLLAFAGTRTQHRMACNIEDAGFEIRDMIAWIYSSGFPKSLNVFKQLTKRCECGNMESYEKDRNNRKISCKQETEHNLRPLQETNLSQTLNFKEEQRKILQSELSEQSLYGTMQGEKSKKSFEGQEKSCVEGRSNLEKTERELQGSKVCEMSRKVSTNGKKGRIHNGTQIGNGETFKQTTTKNGSSTPQRPQSEQQSNREPCAFCKQWGTQALGTFGRGTALKPALEPITLARKPLSEKTIASNVLKWGTGGINIDGCRVGITGARNNGCKAREDGYAKNDIYGKYKPTEKQDYNMGRFPANIIHDGSEEVLKIFPNSNSSNRNNLVKRKDDSINYGGKSGKISTRIEFGDKGSASRFFYCAKTSKSDRNEGLEGLQTKTASELTNRKEGSKGLSGSEEYGNSTNPFANGGSVLPRQNFHPTVKPTKLMQYLVRLVTPPKGIVLDPFMGSGSTGKACVKEKFKFIGIDLNKEYFNIACARIKEETKQNTFNF